jgi:uncharacterized protein YbjT (DUF2867 family)
VRAFVRRRADADNLVALGADVVSGDFADTDSLVEACRGVDGVFYQLPSGLDSETSERWGLAGLDAIARADLRSVIYHTGVQAPRNLAELPGFRREQLEARVRAGAWRWAIIRPTFMLQNLLLPYVTEPIRLRDSIAYPVASDVRLSWAAAEDVGRLTAQILLEDRSGCEINLGSSSQMDGADLAAAFSRGLGRTIRFISLPVNEFEQGVDAALGDGVGRRVSAIFRFIQRHPDDRDFVSRAFTSVPGLEGFQPMAVDTWAKLHGDAFEPVTAAAR